MSFSLVTAINATIACSAILGNGMVIFVMTVRRKQFGSYTNRLIRHQSIVDFVSGLVFLLLKVIKPTPPVQKVDDNILGELLCRFVHSDYLVWGVNVTSTYNLVMISLERFMATCYPVKHRNACSLFKIRVAMCAAWIIGFTYALNSAFLFNVVKGDCMFIHINEIAADVVIATLALSTEYLIPLFIMVFSYTRILLVLRRKLVGNRPGVFDSAKRNVVTTMLVVGILFVVCWTPLEVLKLKTIVTNDFRPLSVYVAVAGILTCNMCVNPVIYCFKYEHFRVQLMNIVRSSFRQNRVHTEEASSAQSIDLTLATTTTHST